MPLLNVEQLERMNAVKPHACRGCHQAVRRNYCRQCDEFFEAGHMEGCPQAADDNVHKGHRTY